MVASNSQRGSNSSMRAAIIQSQTDGKHEYPDVEPKHYDGLGHESNPKVSLLYLNHRYEKNLRTIFIFVGFIHILSKT